jgi:hypothetical protein
MSFPVTKGPASHKPEAEPAHTRKHHSGPHNVPASESAPGHNQAGVAERAPHPYRTNDWSQEETGEGQMPGGPGAFHEQ